MRCDAGAGVRGCRGGGINRQVVNTANVAMGMEIDIKVATATMPVKEARTHPTKTDDKHDKLAEDEGDSAVMVAALPVGIEEEEQGGQF